MHFHFSPKKNLTKMQVKLSTVTAFKVSSRYTQEAKHIFIPTKESPVCVQEDLLTRTSINNTLQAIRCSSLQRPMNERRSLGAHPFLWPIIFSCSGKEIRMLFILLYKQNRTMNYDVYLSHYSLPLAP